MDESFSVSINYKGSEYSFEARLVTAGYIHKFYVIINGLEIIYEPDEERNYRAISQISHDLKDLDLDLELIKAVGIQIESLHH